MNQVLNAPKQPLDRVLLRLKPDLIAHGSVEPLVDVLQSVSSTPEKALRLRSGIVVQPLDPGDGDWTTKPRIASFVWRLYLAWPHWFFFADPRGRTLANLFSCALHALGDCHGSARQKRIDEFYVRGIQGLKVTATACGLNDDDYERLLDIALADVHAFEVLISRRRS